MSSKGEKGADDDYSSDDEGGKPTDCCGNTDAEDNETCPDCGHVCCESCTVHTSRGLCWCKHSLRGDAYWDQMSIGGQNFLRNTFGYRGKFKPLAQVRMEVELLGKYGPGYGPAKPRMDECAYSLCNAPAEGWSKENRPNRTKLTDETLSQFVLCDKCRSAAYCSPACRDADVCTISWDKWDGGQATHADNCQPYMDNDRLPYVSVALRKYKKEFGRYPHPLGLGGDETNTEKK